MKFRGKEIFLGLIKLGWNPERAEIKGCHQGCLQAAHRQGKTLRNFDKLRASRSAKNNSLKNRRSLGRNTGRSLGVESCRNYRIAPQTRLGYLQCIFQILIGSFRISPLVSNWSIEMSGIQSWQVFFETQPPKSTVAQKKLFRIAPRQNEKMALNVHYSGKVC